MLEIIVLRQAEHAAASSWQGLADTRNAVKYLQRFPRTNVKKMGRHAAYSIVFEPKKRMEINS